MKIKFEFEIDTINIEDLKKASAFFASLGVGPEDVKLTTEKKEEKPKRTRRTKAQIAADKAAAEEQANKAGESDTDDSSETVSLDEVRTLVSSKVKEFKAEIKAELGRLKAKNVSGLKEEQYPEFVAFLKSL